MKQFLSMLLIIVLCFSLLPFSAFAEEEPSKEIMAEPVEEPANENDEEPAEELIEAPAEEAAEVGEAVASDGSTVASGTCGNNLIWKLDNNGKLTVSGTGAMSDYHAPLETPWYSVNGRIKCVTITEGVTSVGSSAFSSCSNIQSVTIPSSVTDIGLSFTNCASLTAISVASANRNYCDIDGVLFSKDKTLLYCYPAGKAQTSYVIPDEVITLGWSSFCRCNHLAEVSIPNTVQNIYPYAFTGCEKLAHIEIPNSVSRVSVGAFAYCTGLESATIPCFVDSCAFYDCSSLSSVTIYDGVNYICDSAFYGCDALQTVYYTGTQEQWSNIEINEYNDPILSAELVFMQDDIVVSGTCGNNLTWTLNDKGTLAIFGTGKMYDYFILEDSSPWHNESSKIKKVEIASGVTSIGEFAFDSCSVLESVTIPGTVTSIGEFAFCDCISLTHLTIPHSVTYIGEAWAFSGCSSLTAIYVASTNSNYCDMDGVLFTKNKTKLVYYPVGKTQNAYSIPNGVEVIGAGAFENCRSLMSVLIPDGMTSIGDEAFCGCFNLESITIPMSVTNIGGYGFYGCRSFESVMIPKNVTSIGERAFGWCSRLTDISVAATNGYYSGVDGVLYNKNKTELICYPAGKSQSTYTIPNNVTNIKDWAFEDCTNLTDITISKSVKIIESFTFFGCENLASVTIPSSVTSIGDGAFFQCYSLMDVYFSGTLAQWNSITIGFDNTPLETAKIHYNSKYSYTVTYDANSGSGAPASQVKTEGSSLVLSTKKPMRTGYNFLGWATLKTAKAADYSPGESYSEDASVTLYAVWNRKGDLNGDGAITAADLIVLAKYLSGKIKASEKDAPLFPDLNEDRKTDLIDLVHLMKLLAK